ncbi:MAG: threonine synthase [Treponema sp.]|jgi:threonine synthase|nr:threonine synthase [Treponema sp.]
MKNVLHGRCTGCGKTHAAVPALYTCPACGGIIDIEYDYDYIKSGIAREPFAARTEFSMWRYREFLPVEEGSPRPRLRVGASPLYSAEALGKAIGLPRLYLKDDGLNPTSSLKDRASALAVVKAKEGGFSRIACSSTGNAASSLAGNCAAEGMETVIFVPRRAPQGKVAQLSIFGALVISVDGNYEDTYRLSAEAIEKWGWYNRNAAINPYLVEGKKTVALEIGEQLGFRSPDWVSISVGDGCSIAGVWKGFSDLSRAGLLDRMPRLLGVQASGCCPISTAFTTGEPVARAAENTFADSIAVGVPRNPGKALHAMRASNGAAVSVSDGEIMEAMRLMGRFAGVFAEPAAAASLAGLKKAAAEGIISPGASAVCIVTGNGLKDVQSGIAAAGEGVLALPPDMKELERALAGRCIC